jgi:hypothetical protein
LEKILKDKNNQAISPYKLRAIAGGSIEHLLVNYLNYTRDPKEREDQLIKYIIENL